MTRPLQISSEAISAGSSRATARRATSYGGDRPIGFGAPVTVELPGVADLLDQAQIEVSDDELLAVAAANRDDLPAWIAEVALAVKLADVPRCFVADSVDGADEVAIRDRVRRLLQLPEILGESRDRGRWIQHDLRAVQPEDAGAFGKVTVVADVDADASGGGVEHRVSEIARAEVELLPESWRHVGNMVLAVLAEIPAVRVDDRRRVVVDAGHLFFINRHHHDHAVLLRDLLHQADRRTIRDSFDHLVPAALLLGAEIGPVEELLQAQELHAAAPCLLDERHVLVDHAALDLVGAAVERNVGFDLYESAADDAVHGAPRAVCDVAAKKVGR